MLVSVLVGSEAQIEGPQRERGRRVTGAAAWNRRQKSQAEIPGRRSHAARHIGQMTPALVD